MTNDEIIKAFEICYGIDKVLGCTSCPLYDEESFCQRIDDVSLEEKVFDLINRQKAEIDILIRKKEKLRDEICELQAENERLREIEYMYNDLCR